MKVKVTRKKQIIGEAIIYPKEDKNYTEYDIKKRDILEDDYGRQFQVKTVTVTYGDTEQWLYSKLKLEKINQGTSQENGEQKT